jgi:hypothetical protein
MTLAAHARGAVRCARAEDTGRAGRRLLRQAFRSQRRPDSDRASPARQNRRSGCLRLERGTRHVRLPVPDEPTDNCPENEDARDE